MEQYLASGLGFLWDSYVLVYGMGLRDRQSCRALVA